MTARDRFTDAEWTTVGRAPFMTGVFIASSDLSDAIGIVRELLTVEALVAAEANKHRGLALAKQIFADIEAGTLSSDVGALNDEPETRTRALESVISAVRLVAANDPAQAPAYRDWLVRIAHGVAEATREGRVLRFAHRMSGHEKSALAELERALRAAA
ncbi:hypothetical protein B0I08_107101 [Glaciihabitans tibetensis]|uniref:Uncharacterized protein n=1 Tax=Glaciihabitans tibetensis TaxID=1266600 RepID=A0A2T0VAI4_9MICO|nr:hypothetical protein [Glaciihabitans tibetensis]PRY67206.1 hypothetical protein B0I08_107101 [Glaciihabitans tibetensis]